MSNISIAQSDTNQETQSVPTEFQRGFELFYQAILDETSPFVLNLQDDVTTIRRPTSSEELLIYDNLQNREIEPEDFILVTSGILPKLIAQARQEPPSDDWERVLDEL
jgi:hypothetical protein